MNGCMLCAEMNHAISYNAAVLYPDCIQTVSRLYTGRRRVVSGSWTGASLFFLFYGGIIGGR